MGSQVVDGMTMLDAMKRIIIDVVGVGKPVNL
jgi:hypothetical protein